MHGIFREPELSPENVLPNERITRFVLYHGHFKKETGRVRPEAYTPSRKLKDISVYRTHRTSETDIWSIGEAYVSSLRKDRKPVLARADLSAATITGVGLSVVPHPYPHPRHANVTGWPDDQSERKMKAVELANAATLVAHPDRHDVIH
ncbi:MAG: hypothetical protein A2Z34_05445 [Planctomycetes bacterium RBG_16_59_8]|nr:MAG: hypothetical protein A2Z34_05445 [Planctomycetes bacterium RBG_16_59_8]